MTAVLELQNLEMRKTESLRPSLLISTALHPTCN
ncbi:MAG: class III lanthipeptide [Actinomycetota bacterium]|nr:class III lanthipeptide [Actinomycetota bacterium]